MNQLLDLIERVVPRIRHYPSWAQRLFAGTFALVLVSFFLWVVVSPTAASNAEHSAVQANVGLGAAKGSQAKGSARGGGFASAQAAATLAVTSDRTLARLEQPIVYDLDLATQTIAPDVPYLDLVRTGGPLGGIEELAFDWWSSAATFPKLDVKLTNTGAKTAYLTAAAVHVDRSVPDLEPIPIVLMGARETADQFSILNVGWGRMQQASLRYGIAAGTGRAQPAPLRYRANLGSVATEGSVDVAGAAAAQKLADHGEATVWGELSYVWRDASGQVHRQQDRIITSVYLGGGTPSAGSAAPVQGQYHVELRVAGSNYDVPVPGFDRFISPQSPDRFEIAVSSPRSAIHHGVRVRLGFSDGHSTTSQAFTVQIFEPRDSPAT